MPAQRHYTPPELPRILWATTRWTLGEGVGLWIAEGAIGSVWYNLNIVRARGGFVTLLTATREGRPLMTSSSIETTPQAAKLSLKAALAELL